MLHMDVPPIEMLECGHQRVPGEQVDFLGGQRACTMARIRKPGWLRHAAYVLCLILASSSSYLLAHVTERAGRTGHLPEDTAACPEEKLIDLDGGIGAEASPFQAQLCKFNSSILAIFDTISIRFGGRLVSRFTYKQWLSALERLAQCSPVPGSNCRSQPGSPEDECPHRLALTENSAACLDRNFVISSLKVSSGRHDTLEANIFYTILSFWSPV